MKVYTQRWDNPNMPVLEKAVIEIEKTNELSFIISALEHYKEFWQKFDKGHDTDKTTKEFIQRADKLLKALDNNNEIDMSKFNLKNVQRLDKSKDLDDGLELELNR